MLKTTLTSAAFLFSFSVTFAQEVIGSAGNSGTASNHEISWTLGEIVTETGSLPAHSVTQGFHQPSFQVSLVEEKSVSWSMRVYPNPVARQLFIEPEQQEGDEFKLTLMDLQGRTLHEQEFSGSGTSLFVDNLPNSSYLLMIENKNSGELLKYNLIKSE